EHHDFVVVSRHDTRIHLSLCIGRLERAPGLFPIRAMLRLGYSLKAPTVWERGRPMQCDVRLAEGLEPLTVSSLDGPEKCQHHISVVDQLIAATSQGAEALRAVLVVPPPPPVRRGLRPALRGVLPVLLAPERRQVEERPGTPEGLDPASGREIGAEDPAVVAQEDAEAERLSVVGGEAEVDVEFAAMRRVPGQRPAHALLVPLDVRERG